MRRLRVTDTGRAKAFLQSEAERSPRAAFLHRLHCVALVAAGQGCDAVAAAFGDDRRSVQRWVRRFEEAGVEGLADSPRTGRPAKLDGSQLGALCLALAQPPASFGHAGETWSAETLRREIERRFSIAYSRRHCVRLLGLLRQETAQAPTA